MSARSRPFPHRQCVFSDGNLGQRLKDLPFVWLSRNPASTTPVPTLELPISTGASEWSDHTEPKAGPPVPVASISSSPPGQTHNPSRLAKK